MQWNVLKLRKEHNKSQTEMAKLLGIHLTSYGRKELGKAVFTANELFILSRKFNVKIDDIFLPDNCINNAKNKQEVNQ